MQIKRLEFIGTVDMAEVERTILLAVLCATIIHSEEAVQEAFGYCVGFDTRTAVYRYDDSIAGIDTGKLVEGLCTKEYGFSLLRVRPIEPRNA